MLCLIIRVEHHINYFFNFIVLGNVAGRLLGPYMDLNGCNGWWVVSEVRYLALETENIILYKLFYIRGILEE